MERGATAIRAQQMTPYQEIKGQKENQKPGGDDKQQYDFRQKIGNAKLPPVHVKGNDDLLIINGNWKPHMRIFDGRASSTMDSSSHNTLDSDNTGYWTDQLGLDLALIAYNNLPVPTDMEMANQTLGRSVPPLDTGNTYRGQRGFPL